MIETLVVLQARMSSSRLPGKVLKDINGKPMIYWQIQRILKANIDKLVLVTSNDKSDDVLAKYVAGLGVEVYRGSLEDVFSRFLNVAQMQKALNVVRLTGDCPLVMPDLIHSMIANYQHTQTDYLSNTNPPSFPDGLDVEIFSASCLEKLTKYKLSKQELEHVTLGIYSRPEVFSLRNFRSPESLESFRWTVDYPEDLHFIRSIFGHFKGREESILISDVLKLLRKGTIELNPLSDKFRNIALTEIAREESI